MNTLCRIGTIALLALASHPAPAQTSSPDAATMQALLSEVRQLRHMVERTVTLGPRIQILLQRAQFQDQKVARISQQLDEVRKQITAETARQNGVNDRLAKIEQDLSNEGDPERHKQLEDLRSTLKMVAGNGPDQQLRAHESELSNSLEIEQGSLNELNEKLDALERQLEAPPAASEAGKPR
ncbi:MAG TPA: hypothetical protein VMR62_27620 [Bryobacteraceae bacterium]|jgi:chromosome segregation ATPase|nr:hypothetical protein [Bryobacteraceae bacterium]